MAKMTKAQARRRLQEAEEKFKKVYMAPFMGYAAIVKPADMEAVMKIVARCIKRAQ